VRDVFAELQQLRAVAERQHMAIALQAASIANLGREVQALRDDLRRARFATKTPNQRREDALQRLVPLLATLAQGRTFTAREMVEHPELREFGSARSLGCALGAFEGRVVAGVLIRQVAAKTRDGSLWRLDHASVNLPPTGESHTVTPDVHARAVRR